MGVNRKLIVGKTGRSRKNPHLCWSEKGVKSVEKTPQQSEQEVIKES